MTAPSERAREVRVTQEDREAAASLSVIREHGDMLRAGEYDDHAYVQAFARHRIAATRPHAETVDREAVKAAVFRARHAWVCSHGVKGFGVDDAITDAVLALAKADAILSASEGGTVEPTGALLICDETGGRMWTCWTVPYLKRQRADEIYGDTGGYRIVPLYADPNAPTTADARKHEAGEVTLAEAARDLIEARERLGAAVVERHDLWRVLAALSAAGGEG